MSNIISLVGGLGFVGTRLAKRLSLSKSNFRILDLDVKDQKENLFQANIENPETLVNLNGTSAIIHLAAVHRDDIKPISRYDDVNVTGTLNICNAADQYDIKKIIFTSSVAVYGFANPGTDEEGDPNFFNDYGRTKYEAEKVLIKWQKKEPLKRTLVIVRPTVIFGEGNRGNVFNLLNQVAKKRFVMIGNGKNKKSMAYVENVAAFLEHSLSFSPGIHLYNYIDKPDLDMNSLISMARELLFSKSGVGLRFPVWMAFLVGYFFDFISMIFNKTFNISSIRVKKFISTTEFETSMDETRFIPPVELEKAIHETIKYEFIDNNEGKKVYYTE